ncbi:phage tail spike protein [Peptoniphilus catoniae]|uniref:phage tail spike protein n=1 Tax=Peptoniphilus catoniae TaxID=1660341 RepID=UPI0010FD5101|nr:phage tail spike protein [Peptoniphilus catoniae]
MIYLFDHKENLLGQLKPGELRFCQQEENLNGLMFLDLEIPLNLKNKMKDVEFVAHADVNNEEDFYFYKLINFLNSDASYHYKGINIAYDDFKGYGYLREFRMQNTTAAKALATILNGSRWEAGIAEGTVEKDLYLYDITRLDALGKLIDTFGVELEFKVKIKGNKIVKRFVNMYNKMGYITHKRFVYGHSALKVVKEEDQQNIFTAGIGRGKGEEKFDASGKSTGGFGRRIDFKEVEWSKAKGDPVDKPLGQEYVEIKELTEKYGYSDGTPRFKLVKKENIEDAKELLQATYDELVANSRPLVQFEADISDFGTVYLGDTINIIRHDLDIYYSSRVFKITRDLLNPSATKIELGDNLEYSQVRKNKQILNGLKDLDSRVTEVANNANLTFNDVINEMREGLKNTFFNEDGYNYEFKAGNKYGLPAGYYSFDRPIDKNPTKVIYIGAGKMAIANQKDSNGKWDFKTFGTGDGILAERIVGTLGEFAKVNAENIIVGSDFYKTSIGKEVEKVAADNNVVQIDKNGIMIYQKDGYKYTIDLNEVKDGVADVKKAVIQDKLYNGIKINAQNGFQAIRSDGLVKVEINATDGLRIFNRGSNGDNWQSVLWNDIEGNTSYGGNIKFVNVSNGQFLGGIYKSWGEFVIAHGENNGFIIADGKGRPYMQFNRNNYYSNANSKLDINFNGSIGFRLVANADWARDFAIMPYRESDYSPYGMFIGFLNNSSQTGLGAGIIISPYGLRKVDQNGNVQNM